MLFYLAIYKEDVQDYWAEVPALEGCYSVGNSVSETLNNSRALIKIHVDDLRADCPHYTVVQKSLSTLKALPQYKRAAWHAVKVDVS